MDNYAWDNKTLLNADAIVQPHPWKSGTIFLDLEDKSTIPFSIVKFHLSATIKKPFDQSYFKMRKKLNTKRLFIPPHAFDGEYKSFRDEKKAVKTFLQMLMLKLILMVMLRMSMLKLMLRLRMLMLKLMLMVILRMLVPMQMLLLMRVMLILMVMLQMSMLKLILMVMLRMSMLKLMLLPMQMLVLIRVMVIMVMLTSSVEIMQI